MKDIRRKLQTAYYSLLNGQVSLNGDTVPVYDQMNIESEYPQIVLRGWTNVEESDKSSFGSDVTFTVQIYDRQEQSKGSRGDLYDIIDQVKPIVKARPTNFDLTPEFNLVWTRVDNEVSLPKELESGFITFGTQLRFRHHIEQL